MYALKTHSHQDPFYLHVASKINWNEWKTNRRRRFVYLSPTTKNIHTLLKIAGFIEFICCLSYSNYTFMCLYMVLRIPSSIKNENLPPKTVWKNLNRWIITSKCKFSISKAKWSANVNQFLVVVRDSCCALLLSNSFHICICFNMERCTCSAIPYNFMHSLECISFSYWNRLGATFYSFAWKISRILCSLWFMK